MAKIKQQHNIQIKQLSFGKDVEQPEPVKATVKIKYQIRYSLWSFTRAIYGP